MPWRLKSWTPPGKSISYSWSGPADGTLHPIKGADGQVIGRESLKRDGDALLRHGEDPSDGSSFDSRATMSADGNAITDVTTVKSKDGKTFKTTSVYRRNNRCSSRPQVNLPHQRLMKCSNLSGRAWRRYCL